MSEQTAPETELVSTIHIDAPPAKVWALVSDLRGMARFSDQVVRTVVPGGVRLGARMFNLNHQGWKVWPTTGRVVRFDPEREIAFRVTENRSIWSYRLALADGGGTTLVQRRETPHGISRLSKALTNVVLGGVPQFTRDLQIGMDATMQQIKQTAEA